MSENLVDQLIQVCIQENNSKEQEYVDQAASNLCEEDCKALSTDRESRKTAKYRVGAADHNRAGNGGEAHQ